MYSASWRFSANNGNGNVSKVARLKATRGRKVAKTGVKTNVSKTYGGADRARQNMTGQLRARLSFYKTNLANKERELKQAKGFVGRLPNALKMVEMKRKGVEKSKLDLKNCKARIRKLQREGKINKIV